MILLEPLPLQWTASLIERIDLRKPQKGSQGLSQNVLSSRATLCPDAFANSLRLNWDLFTSGTTDMHGICSSD
jgi:hypothetical protein